MSRGPVLAVGCERSGNTWIGKMLAAAPGTYDLYQPFNGATLRPATPWKWPFSAKNQYIGSENGAAFEGPVRELLQPRIPPEYLLREAARAALGHLPVADAAQRYVRTMGDVLHARWSDARAVMGDPGGIFLAEWLADTFDARVVCVIRHPCGVAAGFKRMGWVRDMSDLLDQPLLMDHLLDGYQEPLEAWNRAMRDGTATWLGQSILWWNLVGHVMAQYQARRRDFLFVRYEELAHDPMRAFEALYARLGLAWTEGARRAVMAATAPRRDVQLDKKLHVLARDSRRAADGWMTRLTRDEIDAVRLGTATVASELSLDLDWGPQAAPAATVA